METQCNLVETALLAEDAGLSQSPRHLRLVSAYYSNDVAFSYDYTSHKKQCNSQSPKHTSFTQRECVDPELARKIVSNFEHAGPPKLV